MEIKSSTGGKVGKGKRFQKYSKDPILSATTKPAILRLARRAGVKRIGGLTYQKTRDYVKGFATKLIKDAITYMELARRKTVQLNDVKQSARVNGVKLYF